MEAEEKCRASVSLFWFLGAKIAMGARDNSDLLKLCQEVLENGSYLRFRALGGSMFPFIRPGDSLTTKTVNPVDISVGEVLLYRREGRPFVHRVIKKKVINGTLLFITRGDHLTSYDPTVRSSQILGKIISIERSGRTIHLDTPFQKFWGRFLALAFSWFHPLFRVVEWPFHLVRRLLSKTNLGLNRFRLIRKIKRRFFSQISYRMASSSDVPSLTKFYEADRKEIFQEIAKGRKYYLAEKGGQVLGGLTAGRAWKEMAHDHSCWVMGLYVVPRYRGANVAEHLLAKAISTLKEQGIDQIFINFFENNIPAMKLYHKLGFLRADMPEVESKINEHYAKVAPGSPRSLVFHKRI